MGGAPSSPPSNLTSGADLLGNMPTSRQGSIAAGSTLKSTDERNRAVSPEIAPPPSPPSSVIVLQSPWTKRALRSMSHRRQSTPTASASTEPSSSRTADNRQSFSASRSSRRPMSTERSTANMKQYNTDRASTESTASNGNPVSQATRSVSTETAESKSQTQQGETDAMRPSGLSDAVIKRRAYHAAYRRKHKERILLNERRWRAERSKKEESGVYTVEALLQRRWRVHSRSWEYLVKWAGFDETENSWEPVENLEGAQKLRAAFDEQLPADRRARRLMYHRAYHARHRIMQKPPSVGHKNTAAKRRAVKRVGKEQAASRTVITKAKRPFVAKRLGRPKGALGKRAKAAAKSSSAVKSSRAIKTVTSQPRRGRGRPPKRVVASETPNRQASLATSEPCLDHQDQPPIADGIIKKETAPSSSSGDSSGEGAAYVVEAVLDRRWSPAKQRLEYWVKWADYGEEDNSWEPAGNLQGARDLYKAVDKRIEAEERAAKVKPSQKTPVAQVVRKTTSGPARDTSIAPSLSSRVAGKVSLLLAPEQRVFGTAEEGQSGVEQGKVVTRISAHKESVGVEFVEKVEDVDFLVHYGDAPAEFVSYKVCRAKISGHLCDYLAKAHIVLDAPRK